MTTLLLDCTHGSTKEGFANAARALVPAGVGLPPVEAYVPAAAHAHAHAQDHGHDAHAHVHHHHSLQEVHAAIEAAPVTDVVKQEARGVYGLIAAAEAKAHGVPETDVHFHEVGAPEAIACVLAACDALSRVSYDHVLATPVCTGFGHVHCAHGVLPIPAPATANVLESVPTFVGSEEGELTTPTGAALAVHFADRFASTAAEAQESGAELTLRCNPC